MASLFVLIPFIAVLIINVFIKDIAKKGPFYLALVLFTAQLACAIALPASTWQVKSSFFTPFFNLPFSADMLSVIMFITIAIIALVTLVLGNHTIKDASKKYSFINLLILEVIGMNGLVMVQDLFSMYVFLEIVAIASFVLIALPRTTVSLEGSFKYLIVSAIATFMILSSIALFIFVAGGTSFAVVANSIKAAPSSFLVLIAIALFLSGLLIKGGLIPFHGWLPDAYVSGPQPVSVLLAGIVTKTTGVYTLIRLTTEVFGFIEPVRQILLFVGFVSIVLGALAALVQTDFKRMLAYSSISQVGFIVIGLGAGTPLALFGVVFHLFNHAIFKSQLFVNAAALEERLNTTDMDAMGGLAQRMPFTGTTSLIASLSAAGIPPLSGFWSKLIIIMALWLSGNTVYAVLAAAASVLTLAYFLIMQRKVFFGKTPEALSNIKEASSPIVVPSVILAVITIAVGLFFPYVLSNYILPLQRLIG